MSVGELDEQGRFTLACFGDDDGALLGTHQVAVKAREPLGVYRMKWHAPPKYASAATSELTQIITESTDTIEIELSWEGQKGPYVQELGSR